MIDKALIDYLSKLSRLELTDGERTQMAGELEQILEYTGLLNELETQAIEPLSHILPRYNIMRPDDVAPSLDRAALLEHAPGTDGASFLVPRTVEQEGAR